MVERKCRICKEPFEPAFDWVTDCPKCVTKYLAGERHLKEKFKKEREQQRLIQEV